MGHVFWLSEQVLFVLVKVCLSLTFCVFLFCFSGILSVLVVLFFRYLLLRFRYFSNVVIFISDESLIKTYFKIVTH